MKFWVGAVIICALWLPVIFLSAYSDSKTWWYDAYLISIFVASMLVLWVAWVGANPK